MDWAWTARALRRVGLVAFVVALGLLPIRAAQALADPNPNGWSLKRINLPVTAAAYVASSNRFVATVGPYNAILGNSLVEMDPASGVVGRHVPVGSAPDEVAVSDDGLVAYVGLLDTAKIVQVDLITFTVVRTFTTYVDEQSALAGVVTDFAVPPGRNDTVVAVLEQRFISPGFRRVTAFRNGVALVNDLEAPELNQIEMLDTSTVYGSGPYATATIALSDAGLAVVDTTDYPNGTPWGDAIKAAGDAVVSGSGKRFDPATDTTLTDFGAVGFVAPDPTRERVTFVDQYGADANPSWLTFEEYDLTDGTLVARHEFRDPPATGADLVVSPTNALYVSRSAFEPYGQWVYLAGPSVAPGDVVAPKTIPSIANAFAEKLLAYDVAALHYDALRSLLYAAVTDASAQKPGRLLAINPMTGLVVRELHLGGSPSVLAASDDSSTLYVGLGGSGDVARVNLATFAEVSRFNLGPSDYPGDSLYAHDIEVRPGTVNTVAIAQAAPGSPIHQGVALFVDGQRRPLVTPTHTGPDYIEFADASTLYGNGWFMHVDALGVTRTAQANFDGGDFELDGRGRMWSQWGWVYDPVSQELDGAVGAPGFDNVPGSVEPVLLGGRIFAVHAGHPSFDGTQLREFDGVTMRRINTRRLSATGTGAGLVATGAGLAMIAEEGLLLLNPVCGSYTATIAGAGSVTGTAGDDVIIGSSDSDVIDGLGGKDVICGLGAHDVLRGGLGNDILIGGRGNDDLVGGDGIDAVMLGNDAVVHRVDLDNVADDGIVNVEADNVRSTNEIVVGSPGNDYVVGGPGTQILRGGAGNDTLVGLAGNDTLDGGTGTDALYGGVGDDVIDGGVGDDYCSGSDGTNKLSLCERT